MERRWPAAFLGPALLVALALIATLLFRHLSYPLVWHDESETAVFAQRVLEYGYPRVRGPKNVVYSLWQRGGVGVDESTGAYTGSGWGQYYIGALGVRLAAGADDFYVRTLCLRLPFALLGALGLALLAAAVLPALGAGRARRLLFATLFALLLAYSVSLVLHLREARHYSLTVFLSAGVLLVFLRRHVFHTMGRRLYTVSLSLLLFLLFNSFHPACTALLIALGLNRLWAAFRATGTPRERSLAFLGDVAPLLVATACIVPLLGFFDFLEQTRGWVARFASPIVTLRNLGFLGAHLLRYEFLAPALALRATLALLRPAARLAGDESLRQRLEIAGFLFLLLLTYALFIAQTPFLFERYFILLSPVITLLLLLDAFSLADVLRLSPASPRTRRVAAVGAVLAAVATLASTGVRLPEFRGRLYELRHQYRGPLDYVIPYLAAKYPDPEELVIATNYEGPAYMFYLGSRVTIGFYGANLERDLEIDPDVIVARPWPEQLEILKRLSERGSYVSTRFPVQNLWWNNRPTLAAEGPRGKGHRFRTPPAEGGVLALIILERTPARVGGPAS